MAAYVFDHDHHREYRVVVVEWFELNARIEWLEGPKREMREVVDKRAIRHG